MMESLIQSKPINLDTPIAELMTIEKAVENIEGSKATGEALVGEASAAVLSDQPVDKPKKLVEDETRRVGRIGKDAWVAYIGSAGNPVYWATLLLALMLASLDPVAENGWIKSVYFFQFDILLTIHRIWSGAVNRGDESRAPLSYIIIYGSVRQLL
jgi:hypothetical protein